jgi:hypothetical protein
LGGGPTTGRQSQLVAILLSALLGLSGVIALPAPVKAMGSQASSAALRAARSVSSTAKPTKAKSSSTRSLAPTPAYATVVQGDHPLVYYRLDDAGCCVAVDSSGNGLNGTYGTSSVTFQASGLIAGDSDTAIVNNGTGTALTTDPSALPSTGARTLELWIRTTNTSWQTLFGYGASTVTGGFFQLSIRPDVHGTVLLFMGVNDDASFYTPYTIDDGRPHQIDLTYDGSALLTFYVDGQQTGQASLATPLATALNAQALQLGNGGDGSFNGTLDEFAAYPSALSPDQVNSLWRSGAAAPACPSPPITGYAAVVAADHPYRYFRLSDAGQAGVDYSGNCRYAGYASSFVHASGLLTGDADGAVGSSAAPSTILGAGVDGSPTTGARTVEVWAQTTNTSWQTFFSYGAAVNGGYFQLSSRPDAHGTLLHFAGWNDDVEAYSPYPIDDGTPHQIIVSYDGIGVITMYVDGQRSAQLTLPSPLSTVLTAQALLLGSGVDPAFNGTLDELALYPAALTPEQVDRHWQAGIAAAACPATPTTGYAAAVSADHPFRYFRLGDTGRAALDYSGSCRDAAYATGVPRVPGLLVADADGGIGTPVPSRVLLSAAMDGSPSTGARTFEFWEETTNTSWQDFFAYGSIGATGELFSLAIRPDGRGTVLFFSGWNDDFGLYTPYVINDGYPHQIAISYDGAGGLTFFVDGAQIGQTSLTTPLNTSLGAPLLLSSAGNTPFNGLLDELSIYPTALSAAQVNAHYQAGAVPPGYSLLGGTVTAGSSPLPGARPQACPSAGGACFFALPSGPQGAWHVAVPNGTYTVTVFPPTSAGFVAPVTVGPFTLPPSVTNLAIAFGGGQGPPGTVTTQGGSTTGSIPTVNWSAGWTYTVSGCVGGFGVLDLEAFNTSTGKPESILVPLVETPVNSGTYVAHVPALAPLHGLASVAQRIVCLGKTSVLPDGGSPAGGTHVLLAGSGLTGATAVFFGSSPAESFSVFDDNIIKAVSPPGTGTVNVSVTTASGSTLVIGTYTYIAVTAVSPSNGPSAGGTVVTITGQGFTNVKGVMFGLLPATSFTVDSSTQITAVAPSGLGTIDVQVENGFAVTDAVTGSLFGYQGGPPGSSNVNEGIGPFALAILSGQIIGDGFCDASYQGQQITGINFGQLCEGALFIINAEGPSGVLQMQLFIIPVFTIPAIIGALLLDDPELLFGLTEFLIGPYFAAILVIAAIVVFWLTYIDPDGTVVDTAGNPVDGATATIEEQGSGGAFAAVPAASGVIIPATNPEVTDATGAFQWDALAGSYLIQASKTGCHAPLNASQPAVSTSPFTIPPEVVGLVLTLECPGSAPAAPSVTNLYPSNGVSAGGTQVDISGTGLADNPIVHFGNAVAQSVTVLSPYSIVAIAPTGTSTVDVTVTTAGGTSGTGASTKYGYFTPTTNPAAPTITSVSPASGPQAGGNTVKIFGSGLSGAFVVSFGNFNATQITNVSSTEVDVVVPAGAGDGPVGITLANANGTSAPAASATYTYGSPPDHSTSTGLLSSANPSTFSNAITLTATVTPGGSGTPTGVVTFTDTSTATTLGTVTLASNGGVVTATVTTAQLGVGSHNITASYGGDNNFNPSSGALVQVVNPGPLNHLVLSPASSTITAGGTQTYAAEGFDQFGNDLGDVTSGTTFTIAPNGSCTSAVCTATVPGTHTVTGTDGSATGTATLSVNAAGLDHLVLSPAPATITAGGSQTYTAEGFDKFGNDLGNVTASTTFAIAPNGSCTGATCTATVAGAHTVTGSDGTAIGTASLTVNAAALNYLALTPASTTITAGGSQTYTAEGFDQFGNDLGNVTSSTTFTIAPNGSCTGATCTATVAGVHAVTGTDGSAIGSSTLSVNAAGLNRLVLSPASSTITAGGSNTYAAEGFDQFGNDLGNVTSATTFAIGPNGSCTGATCTATVAGTHTVTGTDGSATGTATLSVNAAALNHLVLSPASATITAGGSQSYTAEGFDQYNNDLGSVTSATTFAIAPNGSCTGASCAATVAGTHSVTGTDGTATGTATLSVNAAGLNHLVLSPASATIAAGATQTYAAEGFDQFGNDRGNVTSATTFTIAPDGSCSGATCTATVAGTHTVTGTDGTATGTASLTVKVTAAPTITQISPNSGSTSGGTVVTVTGANFVAGATVSVGTKAGTNVNVTSSTTLTFTTPSGASGTVDVRVTTSVGTSAIVAADKFTYGPPPTVTSVKPSSGPPAGGTTVTITGTNLSTTIAVYFGPYRATNVVIKSGTSLTVKSPSCESGTAASMSDSIGFTSGTPGTVSGPVVVDVVVTTKYGSSPKNNDDHFSYTGGTLLCS